MYWIAVFAILMSALAPVISQAISLAQHGQGFAMEICAADGSKMRITAQPDEQSNQIESAQPCPYCFAQSAIVPVLNLNLKFQSPQSFTMLPQLFYKSAKPLAVWLTPPSAAPPTQA